MRPRARFLVAAASVTTLLLASASPSQATTLTSAESSTTPAAVTEAAVEFDGQALFTGLILGHGPVAEQYPDLATAGLGGADAETLTAFTEAVTEAVPAVDPTFFDSFAEAITSGDRVQVDRGLTTAQQVLETTLTQELGATLRTSVDDQRGTCIAVLIYLAAVVAVAAVAGAVVNAAANINVAVNYNQVANVSSVDSAASQLAYEQLVDSIAQTFAS